MFIINKKANTDVGIKKNNNKNPFTVLELNVFGSLTSYDRNMESLLLSRPKGSAAVNLQLLSKKTPNQSEGKRRKTRS